MLKGPEGQVDGNCPRVSKGLSSVRGNVAECIRGGAGGWQSDSPRAS